jgi:hypothetical protein
MVDFSKIKSQKYPMSGVSPIMSIRLKEVYEHAGEEE